MHEAGLAIEILEQAVAAARQAGGPDARIESLRLRVGEFSGVDPEALRFALEVMGRGGPAEGARVDLQVEPLVLSCACGAVAGSESLHQPCPACGSASRSVTAGRDLVLEGLEIAD
ncbi:MAG: hydrogenase maturation nickel metallochaperone HypA [Acidobacteria bacterium]|nr:hydrogenase maturation nickel metallochaperone HypA [Acidobacteriota bacterium]